MTALKSDTIYSLEEDIFHSYPPDLLDDVFHHYFQNFLLSTDRYFKTWNLNLKEFEGLTVRKREIVRLFSITLIDSEIFTSWMQQLPYMVSNVFATIVWEGKQVLADLDARTKGNILLTSKDKQISRDRVNPEYCLFLLSNDRHRDFKGNPSIFLNLPASVRKECRRHLPKPKGYYLKRLKPTSRTAHEFCDQGALPEAFAIILEFIKQGHLEQTKNGMARKQSLSRLSRQSGLQEFYADTSEPALKLLRIELVAWVVRTVLSSLPDEDPLIVLQQMQSLFTKAKDPVLIRFMDHIKGWYHASNFLKSNYHSELTLLIKELPPDQWVSFKQLVRFCQVRGFGLFSLAPEGCKYLYISGGWQGWGHTRQELSPRHVPKMISEPLLKAYLFMFSAFGILDTRYDPPRETIDLPDGYRFYSVFDGLKQVRLTSLGTFVLDLTTEYQTNRPQSVAAELFLDEDRLLITLSTADARFELFLEQVAHRIGRLRFKIDFDSFLKGCESKEDLLIRIDRFRALLKDKTPPNWKDFLNTVKDKAESLMPEEDYQIYRLNPEDKELLDLLVADKELRNLITLAEEYRILVRKRDITQLKKRLRIFGYLF